MFQKSGVVSDPTATGTQTSNMVDLSLRKWDSATEDDTLIGSWDEGLKTTIGADNEVEHASQDVVVGFDTDDLAFRICHFGLVFFMLLLEFRNLRSLLNHLCGITIALGSFALQSTP